MTRKQQLGTEKARWWNSADFGFTKTPWTVAYMTKIGKGIDGKS